MPGVVWCPQPERQLALSAEEVTQRCGPAEQLWFIGAVTLRLSVQTSKLSLGWFGGSRTPPHPGRQLVHSDGCPSPLLGRSATGSPTLLVEALWGGTVAVAITPGRTWDPPGGGVESRLWVLGRPRALPQGSVSLLTTVRHVFLCVCFGCVLLQLSCLLSHWEGKMPMSRVVTSSFFSVP